LADAARRSDQGATGATRVLVEAFDAVTAVRAGVNKRDYAPDGLFDEQVATAKE
jgi:hypothetical protein